MQLQLALPIDRPSAQIAAIAARVLGDADHLRARPHPEDPANAAARAHLLAGAALLVDWLTEQTTLPADSLDWPCSACHVPPGQPCDLPERVDKWTGPLPRYHLERGVSGRWASICRPRICTRSRR